MCIKINEKRTEIRDSEEMVVGTITNPVIFELWDGSQENSVIRTETSYQ